MALPRALWGVCALSALLMLAPAQAQQPAASDLAAALNAQRAKGCAGQPGLRTPLVEQAALTRAARLVAEGSALDEALRQAGYKANQSVLIALGGLAQAQAQARFLAERHCTQLLRPTFSDIGRHQRGDKLWVVLAAPFTAPDAEDAPAVARDVLRLVNLARAQPRRCGAQQLPAAAPLVLNDTLHAAALGHARDMARNGYFDHTGRDGSQPADRVTRAGYRWRAVGENIAAGQNTAADAVAGWLKSPGHCANLMRAEYTQMGLAFAVNRASQQGIYWVQLFGRPR